MIRIVAKQAWILYNRIITRFEGNKSKLTISRAGSATVAIENPVHRGRRTTIPDDINYLRCELQLLATKRCAGVGRVVDAKLCVPEIGVGAENTKTEGEAKRVVRDQEREISAREAPKIDVFPMQNSSSHGARRVAWTARNRESSMAPVSLSFPALRLSLSLFLVRLAFYHHHRLRHLRPEQNRERYRSN